MKDKSGYWADNYQQNRLPVDKAIARIRSGQWLFIGSSCGEPQHLVKGEGEMVYLEALFETDEKR